MSRRLAQSRNESMRANGVEPEPGDGAGVKRHMRYIARMPAPKIKIKKPDRYLNSHERGMKALVAHLSRNVL